MRMHASAMQGHTYRTCQDLQRRPATHVNYSTDEHILPRFHHIVESATQNVSFTTCVRRRLQTVKMWALPAIEAFVFQGLARLVSWNDGTGEAGDSE